MDFALTEDVEGIQLRCCPFLPACAKKYQIPYAWMPCFRCSIALDWPLFVTTFQIFINFAYYYLLPPWFLLSLLVVSTIGVFRHDTLNIPSLPLFGAQTHTDPLCALGCYNKSTEF